MKRIIDYCEERRTKADREHPFIRWLRNENVSVEDRLRSWLPHLSIFAFAFKDLNNLLMQYPVEEAMKDERKRIINEHGHQDGTHWIWYLNDMRKLGLNKTMTYTDTVNFMWDDDRERDRLFFYQVAGLLDEAQDPLLRYCIIAPLEFFAHLLFDETAKLGSRYAEETDIYLEYLGLSHAGVEPGGLINEKHEITDERAFVEAVLDESTYRRGMEIVKFMCDEIEIRWQGNLNYVHKRLWVGEKVSTV